MNAGGHAKVLIGQLFSKMEWLLDFLNEAEMHV